ncbi:hypothetical protein [Gordonia caeni]|uniref:RecT-like ssDNA binding protein n=1 Tax=Gordonia caeni TaxID=1007097 RepID=A0ABP7PCN1_9ACTN
MTSNNITTPAATELAEIDPAASVLPAATPTADATATLLQHAQTMQAAHQLATALCSSELVPAMYRGKPDNGAAAILYGAELGLSPIQAMQQIFVVHGAPAIYARTMVALVKSKGYLVQTVESSDASVTVAGRDPRTGVEEVSTWTFERAQKAGYTKNSKYGTDPQGMLYAKAATEVCRKLAPEVLLGIAYSREELELEEPSVPVRRRGGSGVAGLKATLAVDPEAQPEAPAQPAQEPQPVPEAAAEPSITAAQLKKLHTLLTKWDLTDRHAALAWLSQQVDRPLGSSKDLTKVEAAELIGFIEAEQASDAEASR